MISGLGAAGAGTGPAPAGTSSKLVGAKALAAAAAAAELALAWPGRSTATRAACAPLGAGDGAELTASKCSVAGVWATGLGAAGLKLAGLGAAGLAVAIDRSGFGPGTSSAASEALAATGLGADSSSTLGAAGLGADGNCGLGSLSALTGVAALVSAASASGEGALGSRPATGWELTSLIGVSSSRLRAAEASAALGTTEAGL